MMGAGIAWMLVGVVLFVVLAAGAAAAIVLATQRHVLPPGSKDRHEAAGGDAAMDALRERYARGEIDEAELDRRLGGLLRN